MIIRKIISCKAEKTGRASPTKRNPAITHYTEYPKNAGSHKLIAGTNVRSSSVINMHR